MVSINLVNNNLRTGSGDCMKLNKKTRNNSNILS